MDSKQTEPARLWQHAITILPTLPRLLEMAQTIETENATLDTVRAQHASLSQLEAEIPTLVARSSSLRKTIAGQEEFRRKEDERLSAQIKAKEAKLRELESAWDIFMREHGLTK
jgi:hypothetical protein